MKSSECLLKTRVGWIAYDHACKGVAVTAITKRPDGVDTVIVEWDNGQVQKVEVCKLFHESEIDAEVERNRLERLRLEAEFAVVAAKVKVKADAAAALINEAQEIAKTLNKEVRHMSNASYLLQEALDNSGWYSSSNNC